MLFSITSGIFSAAFASDGTTDSAYSLDTTTDSVYSLDTTTDSAVSTDYVWDSTTESASELELKNEENIVKNFSNKENGEENSTERPLSLRAQITTPSVYDSHIGRQAIFNIVSDDNPGGFDFFEFTDNPALLTEDNYTETLIIDDIDLLKDLRVVITDYYIDSVNNGLWYKLSMADGSDLPESIKDNPWVMQYYIGEEVAGGSLIVIQVSGGVTVSGAGIPEGAVFSAVEIEDTAIIDAAFRAIGEALFPVDPDDPDADRSLVLNRPYRILDLNFYKEGEKEPPTGIVQVTVPVADLGILDGESCVIYHLHDDGTLDTLYVNAAGGAVTFKVDKFSTFTITGGTAKIGGVVSAYKISWADSQKKLNVIGVYFDNEGNAHILFDGKNNDLSKLSKATSVTLNGTRIEIVKDKVKVDLSVSTIKFYSDQAINKNPPTQYLGEQYDLTVQDGLGDLNLGQVTIPEDFQLIVHGLQGAYTVDAHVATELKYDIIMNVHSVGNVEYHSKNAPGIIGKQVIFEINVKNTGTEIITEAVISANLNNLLFDSSSILYSTNLEDWSALSSITINDKTYSNVIDNLALDPAEEVTYYVQATIKSQSGFEGSYSSSVKFELPIYSIFTEDSVSIDMSSSFTIVTTVHSVNGENPLPSGTASAFDSALVKGGNTVIYKITITNTGDNPLSNIVITNQLPIGAYIHESDGSIKVLYWETDNPTAPANVQNGQFEITTVPTLDVKNSVTYYVKIVVPDNVLSGTYTNVASASTMINSNTVTLQDSANIVVNPISDYDIFMHIHKVNDTSVEAPSCDISLGDTVIYEIIVSNNSNYTLKNTQVKVTLPGCMNSSEVYKGTSDNSLTEKVTVTDDSFVLYTGDMDVGFSNTYYVKTTVKASSVGNYYTNTAYLYIDGVESDSNSATVRLITITSGDLIISVTDSSTLDANQSFLYGVTGPGIDLTVVVHGNSSVTIVDLPPGQYTVTELSDWSWRYTPINSKSQEKTVTAGATVTATFGHERNKLWWLDGNAWRDFYNGISKGSPSVDMISIAII